MASEAVKKILAAESDSGQKISEAKKRKEEIISDAEGRSAMTIQKKLSEAATESARIKQDYDRRLEEYTKETEARCSGEIEDIRRIAGQNMDKAVEAVISRFFTFEKRS